MPAVAPAAGLPSRLGKYELLLPLAAGGMAHIYIGRSTGIGSFERHVVLKMITPERANDATAVNMFLDEARLAASLNHQNVAQVFEVGEEGGIHFLAMEYVHGQDLRALLAKAGGQGTRIPLELALTVVAGAAAGLNHAHERRGPDGTPLGIVHRDVSPSNIMIGYDGAVKLLDFGIAKATARSVETQSGIIKGKFAYMAPEQCRGRDVDRRSDVFSLGIILYEISTQHRCFRADSDFDTMHRIVTGDVVRPTRVVQNYPQALEAIVMKALAVDAAQRYQSAGLLLEAIESFAVASRMSLSTMGLGRFMRDMFGEIQEPWLNASARMVAPAALPPKESTISSTEGRGAPAVELQADSVDAAMVDEESDDELEAMQTVLQSGQNAGQLLDWNAKSYPTPAPRGRDNAPTDPVPYVRSSSPVVNAHVVSASGPVSAPHTVARAPSNQMAVPAAASRRTTPMPGVPAHDPLHAGLGGSTVLGTAPPTLPIPNMTPLSVAAAAVPANQFQHAPASGSGPAIGLPLPSTKHGYASGAGMTRNDPSHAQVPANAQFEPLPSTELQIRPNRRPLIIGIAVVVLGIIVMIAVLAKGGDKDKSNAAAPDQDEHESRTPDTSAPTPPPPTPPVAPANAATPTQVPAQVPPTPTEATSTATVPTPTVPTPTVPTPTVPTPTVPADAVPAKGEQPSGAATTPASSPTNKTVKAATPAKTGAAKSTTTTVPAKATPNKTATGTQSKTGGTGTTTNKPKPKCQPPGPNVDPFGLPVCKS